MRKRVSLSICVVVAFVLVGIASCSKENKVEAPSVTRAPAQEAPVVDINQLKANLAKNPKKNSYYFVFVPKLVHPFYEPIKQGFESVVEEYAARGIKITWDWDAPAAADAILQTEKIEQSVIKNPDAIGIAVQEPAVIDTIVAEVEKAGIPVVLFADDTASGTGSAFVGIKDLVGTGVTMGDLLADSIGKSGEVALLVGTLTAQSHIERNTGIKQALSKYPGIKIVAEQASDDNLQKAVEETEKLLNAYPNLKAVIASDGSGAAGAARAVVDSGKKGKVLVYGFDDIVENINGIRDSSIAATYAQDAFSTGYYTMKAMIEVADNKPANKISIESDNRLLVVDTLDKYGY
jgi:ribose transport system substrate-binding protein